MTWLSVSSWLHDCRHTSVFDMLPNGKNCWTLQVCHVINGLVRKWLTGIRETVLCVCVLYWSERWVCPSPVLSVYVGFWCLPAVHSVVKKVAQYMADVLEDTRDKVQENLPANGGEWCLQVTQRFKIILDPKQAVGIRSKVDRTVMIMTLKSYWCRT